MRAVYINLPDTALDALRKLAERETRAPKHQAARLILDGLRREGLLASEASAPVANHRGSDR
jgi:hypothetical protein